MPTLLRRWLRPARKPMTLKQAAVRFTFVFLVLYIASNVMLLDQYGRMDWTEQPVEGCPPSMICGTQTPVEDGSR